MYIFKQGKSEGFDTWDPPCNLAHIDFSARMTLKFEGWPQKTIGNLFRGPRNYMCHLITICEFKLKMCMHLNKTNPRNFIAATGLKILFKSIFRPLWSCNWTDTITITDAITIGRLFYVTSSFVRHSVAIWEFKHWSCSPEMLNSGQNRHFLARVTLKSHEWPPKIIGHLCYAASSFAHHFAIIVCTPLFFGNKQYSLWLIWHFWVGVKYEYLHLYMLQCGHLLQISLRW